MDVQSGPGLDLLDILAGLAIVLALAGIVAWIFIKKARRAATARAAWEPAAEKLGIDMDIRTHFGGDPAATFSIEGIPGAISVFENVALITQIRLALATPPDGAVGFYPRAENFAGRPTALIDWVETEDPTLDALFRVHSNPPELIHALLGSELTVLFRKHQEFFERAFVGIVDHSVEIRLMDVGKNSDIVAQAIELAAEVSRIIDGRY